MKLLKVDTLNEAREKLLRASAGKTPQTETVPFTESLGRVLAADLRSNENIPGFRKSTVDGYAVRSADTQGVTESIPVFLDIIEEVAIGSAPQKTVEPGQAVYVPTGGMLPEGADAMVMIEYCEKFDDTSIAVYDAVSPGRNVIAEGEDISREQIFLEKGSRIRPQEVGVLSSAGVSLPEVFRPWKITIISTGDELVGADETPQKGQIRDINTYSVMASAMKHGFEIVDMKVLKDNEALLEAAVSEAMKTSDIVVASGGSSQGEKDHTADVMDRLSGGGVFTHGIALKPGKPTILGYDNRSETVLIGLPGHPAAALMVFELTAVWLYRQLTGQKEPKATIAEITENVAAAGGRTTCLLVELEEPARTPGCKDSGICRAHPIIGKSGLMTTLTRADGYTMIDVNDEGLKEGQQVKVILF
ncbi:MAG: molybdopterin molybdotransferase MoeA [Lentihominibacter sp.]|nr:molybdopterin molybdotransferase MoeA [Lentihominibacter sp.]